MTEANPYFVLERTALGHRSARRLDTARRADRRRACCARRAEQVRTAFGPGPLRAAGSVDFLGLSARLLSPVLAALVTRGTAPVLSLSGRVVAPAVPGPMRLAVPEPEERRAHTLTDAVLVPVIVPLVGAYAAAFALSRKVLWGNVGSALNGAAVALGRGRPGRRRTTCCLLYRLGAACCGDCVLRARH